MNTSKDVVCFPYPSGVCQTHLASRLTSMNCNSAGHILVSQDGEDSASGLIGALSFLAPSESCVEEVVPFLCQYLFVPCDGAGTALQPTRAQCEEIRDNVCSSEWMRASMFVELPSCESFPSEQASCIAGGNSSGSGSGAGGLVDGLGGSGLGSDGGVQEDSTLRKSNNYYPSLYSM